MSKTESFESVLDTLLDGFIHNVLTNQLRGPYDMIAANIERLRAAHAREIRDTAQQQYARGFNDGKHSMDAEHRAIAMRLRALPLDGGSHENLSQIARAVYHSDWGWTKGACAALRDELVRLMGGVSDGTVEPMTTDEFIKYVEEDTRRLKGDGNLSKSPKTIKSSELTTDLNHGNDEKPSITEVSDELSEHLKTINLNDGYNHFLKTGDNDDTCCCAGGGACAADCGCDSGEQEEVEHGGAAYDCAADSRGGDGGGDLHLAGVSIPDITDELRKWVEGQDNGIKEDQCWILEPHDERKLLAELTNIADRIDEQFDRICWQQEAVLQSTIDGMVDDRDNLLDLLRDARDEYMNTQAVCDELRYQREELMRKWMHERVERKELQAKLDKANGENKGLRLSIDEQKESIAQRKKTIGKLSRDNEKVWKKVHELQAKMDEYDRTHVELPSDANGEVFRVGCTVRMVERHPDVLLTVHGMTMCYDGEWLLMARDDEEEYFCNHSASEFEVCEKPQDTAESIVRDLNMGVVTESEAIERIGKLNG